MKINYNMSAIFANDNLAKSENLLNSSIAKLSSGYKINHAKDNPSGIAISKKMHAQIRGLSTATQSASDGISIIEIAEGALTEVHDMLQRLNELSIKGANGTMSDGDRKTLQEEVDQLLDEVNRVAETTEFNGSTLLDGSFDLKGYTEVPDDYVAKYGLDKNVLSSSVTVENFSDAAKAGYYEVSFSLRREIIEKTDEDGNTYTEYVNSIDPKEPAKLTDAGTKVTVHDNEFDLVGVEHQKVTFNADGRTISIAGDDGFTIRLDIDVDKLVKNIPDAAMETETYTDEVKTGRMIDDYELVTEDGKTVAKKIEKEETEEKKYQKVAKDIKININLTKIGAMTMQIGANEGQVLDIRIPKVSTKTLGIDKLDLTTGVSSFKSIDRTSEAIDRLSSIRSGLGAYQNRLEHTVSSLNITSENMTAAYSRIMDVDMATEMTEYTKNQVLSQAGTSILAQANERPSQILQLLQ